MLNIIISDSEIELIPPELKGNPVIRRSARARGKTPGEILLDSSLHAAALLENERRRRGRPDLIHNIILTLQDSIINLRGQLRVAIHTRNDQLITLGPETRIPRNLNRFVGLAEQLFLNNMVPVAIKGKRLDLPGPMEWSMRRGNGGEQEKTRPLMWLNQSIPLISAVSLLRKRYNGKLRVAVLDQGATQEEPEDYFRKWLPRTGEFLMILGGFPEGEYMSPVYEEADDILSLHSGPLMASTVAAELVVGFRKAMSSLKEEFDRI